MIPITISIISIFTYDFVNLDETARNDTKKICHKPETFKYDKCVVRETSLELYKSHPRKMFPDFMDLFYMW